MILHSDRMLAYCADQFYVLTWLDQEVPKYLSKRYSVRVFLDGINI